MQPKGANANSNEYFSDLFLPFRLRLMSNHVHLVRIQRVFVHPQETNHQTEKNSNGKIDIGGGKDELRKHQKKKPANIINSILASLRRFFFVC